DLLDDLLVAKLGGSDEVVVGAFKPDGEPFPIQCQLITVILGSLAISQRGLLDFLSMLVQPGQEKGFLPKTASRARNDVGYDLFVRVPQVRLAVDVINRGGQVKALAHVP